MRTPVRCAAFAWLGERLAPRQGWFPFAQSKVLSKSAISRTASGEAFCESEMASRENIQYPNDSESKTPALVKYPG